jgi:peptidoglycan hydrolase-like protein with peptidoglycan-binding domain
VVSNLLFTLFLLVFSAGCGLLTAEREAEKVPEKATPTQVAESPPVESKSAVNADSVTVNSSDAVVKPTRLEAKALTQGEIRRMQAKLKASGFDPGPIDGILGPKTKSAFLSLQSSCSELLGVTDQSGEDRQLKPVKLLTVLFEQPGHETFSKEEIQRVQMRLKQSGFDPGPPDGIIGPKTNAALLRARAGCSLTKQFPLLDGYSPLTGSQPAPTFIHHRETPTAPNSPRPADSFGRKENNKISLVADMSAGGDKLRALQIHLKNAGFDPGPVDGILGPRTRSALQRYRASKGVGDIAGGPAGNGARVEY